MIAAKAACAAASRAVVRSSRAARAAGGRGKAGERDAAFLSGGQRAGRKVDHMREADARQHAAARLARTIAAERASPEGQVLARGQRAFQGVRRVGPGPARRRSAQGRRLSSAKPPVCRGRKRHSARNRLDLQAPFGPVTTSAEGSSASNESPSKSRRPPRSMAKLQRKPQLRGGHQVRRCS